MRSGRIGVMAGHLSPPHPDPADPGGRSSGPRARLVIADDDPVVQAMLDMSLGREFEVVGLAADSEQAVELARASQPDAALVDVRMPKGGGLLAVKGFERLLRTPRS